MDLSEFQQYLPFLIPVIVIELALMIAALVDLIKRAETRGPKWVWLLVIVLFNFVGPIIYFVLGRRDE
jgi:hypothetical protein